MPLFRRAEKTPREDDTATDYVPAHIASDGKDWLTGLWDLSGLRSQCDAWAEPYGLVWADLNGFAYVNHDFGHTFGDEVLRWLATQLALVLPPEPDVILGRMGGDEFVVATRQMDRMKDLEQTVQDTIGRPIDFTSKRTIDETERHMRLQFRRGCVASASKPVDGLTFDEIAQSAGAKWRREIESQHPVFEHRRPVFEDFTLGE